MEQQLTLAQHYLSKAAARTVGLLDEPALLIERQGSLGVHYAPFDYIATGARLVVVGITPGLTQAENALSAAGEAIHKGSTIEEALRTAKLTGSFSGPLRNNLVAMLDDIGAHHLLEVSSAAQLFTPGSERIHFTSALRYPVFVNRQNYNGTPDMLGTPILRRMVETYLAEEARLLPDAIWLPLGPKADVAVKHMVELGHLNPRQILSGLPHPSGANAERVAVFLGRKDPSFASRQTNGPALVEASRRLRQQIVELRGVSA